MEVTTFPNSVLARPNFHDGYLDGVRLQKDKSVVLYCRTRAGDEYEITARELVRLCARDFTEGNIINQLLLHEARECRRSLIANVFRLDETRQPGHVENAMERVKGSNWKLLEVVISTECTLLALFGGTLTMSPDLPSQ